MIWEAIVKVIAGPELVIINIETETFDNTDESGAIRVTNSKVLGMIDYYGSCQTLAIANEHTLFHYQRELEYFIYHHKPQQHKSW